MNDTASGILAFADAVAGARVGSAELNAFHAMAHGLYGAGKTCGFPAVTEIGGAFEELVGAIRAGRIMPAAELEELLRSAAAAFSELAEVKSNTHPANLALSDLAWKCEGLLRRASNPGASCPVPQPSST